MLIDSGHSVQTSGDGFNSQHPCLFPSVSSRTAGEITPLPVSAPLLPDADAQIRCYPIDIMTRTTQRPRWREPTVCSRQWGTPSLIQPHLFVNLSREASHDNFVLTVALFFLFRSELSSSCPDINCKEDCMSCYCQWGRLKTSHHQATLDVSCLDLLTSVGEKSRGRVRWHP